MSSFPDHEANLAEIKKLGLNVDSIDSDDDPYDSWDYDVLTNLVTELLDIIRIERMNDESN
jgi:hypothetical protein